MKVIPPKAPSRRKWISLTSALTWLAFERASELTELLAMAKARNWSDDYLRKKLTSEWLEVADAACDGSIQIRASQHDGTYEIPLGTEELRNLRHVGWIGDPPILAIDRFPFTFTGGFRKRASGLKDELLDPVVWRADLISYKKAKERWSRPHAVQNYDGARKYLDENLPLEESPFHLKAKYVQVLKTRFGLPATSAVREWTAGARRNGIRLHGRPPKTEKKKLD